MPRPKEKEEDAHNKNREWEQENKYRCNRDYIIRIFFNKNIFNTLLRNCLQVDWLYIGAIRQAIDIIQLILNKISRKLRIEF